jgi:hypothetical protein
MGFDAKPQSRRFDNPAPAFSSLFDGFRSRKPQPTTFLPSFIPTSSQVNMGSIRQ